MFCQLNNTRLQQALPFILPALVFIVLLIGLVASPIFLTIAIFIGIGSIVVSSYTALSARRYSLDYIAFLAMIVSLVTHEYIAGAIVALMVVGGEALELFAEHKAYSTLKALSDTIPKHAFVKIGGEYKEKSLQQITEGDIIMIKRGELVPLDGIIESSFATLNLAYLTGEVDPVERKRGTFIKSGSVNVGDTLEVRVVGNFSTSTYHKIVKLVEESKLHPARMVRMSERANYYFTGITFLIALGTFAFTGDMVRLLAVLVIATPCPLLIATPVAFVSGMSSAARKRIIVRRSSAFEVIDSADSVFFDKTGTLTLGRPLLVRTQLLGLYSEEEVLARVAGLEIHSLHPLAKAVIDEVHVRGIHYEIGTAIKEQLGVGIEGIVAGIQYKIVKEQGVGKGLELSLIEKREEGEHVVARLYFKDELKSGAVKLIDRFKKEGIRVLVITGDTEENAERVFGKVSIAIQANQSPEDKYTIVEDAHTRGERVVMIGDGLNDAPALARADAGVVFSGTENGASTQAADVAILGSGLEKVEELFSIAHRTVAIAKQSMYGGIILSVIGMLFAAMGLLSPIVGSILQECIDGIVILNALRALFDEGL